MHTLWILVENVFRWTFPISNRRSLTRLMTMTYELLYIFNLFYIFILVTKNIYQQWDYIRCSSHVGWENRTRTLSLAQKCLKRRTILHELVLFYDCKYINQYKIIKVCKRCTRIFLSFWTANWIKKRHYSSLCLFCNQVGTLVKWIFLPGGKAGWRGSRPIQTLLEVFSLFTS